jgi:ribonuclease HI
MIASTAHYPKKRYKLKKPVEEIYSQLVKEKTAKEKIKKEIAEKIKKEYEFTIYTDGGYNKEHSVGSWSYIIKVKHGKKHFKLNKGGGTLITRYNLPILMELKAVIAAIEYITNIDRIAKLNYRIKKITVISDNRQVINSKLQYQKYKENDWRLLRTNNEMIDLLKDTWEAMNEINEKYDINYQWTRGHDGNSFNEQCDKAFRARIKTSIIERKIFAYNNTQL